MTKPLSPVQLALLPQVPRNSHERYYLLELMRFVGAHPGQVSAFFKKSENTKQAVSLPLANSNGKPLKWVTRQVAMRFILYVRSEQGRALEEGRPPSRTVEVTSKRRRMLREKNPPKPRPKSNKWRANHSAR